MQERGKIIGAELQIHAQPGEGTDIILELQLCVLGAAGPSRTTLDHKPKIVYSKTEPRIPNNLIDLLLKACNRFFFKTYNDGLVSSGQPWVCRYYCS